MVDTLVEDWKKLHLMEEENTVLGGKFKDVNDVSMQPNLAYSHRQDALTHTLQFKGAKTYFNVDLEIGGGGCCENG